MLKKIQRKRFYHLQKGRRKKENKDEDETEVCERLELKVITTVFVPPLDHTSAVDLEMAGEAKDGILC